LWAYPPDQLFINFCSFTDNEALRVDDSALGGAVRTGNAPLQMANSLFARNHADVHGGAYWTRGNYPTQIVSSTFFQNTAGVEGEDGGYGGALSGFNMHLQNLTFVENHAEFTGGAVSAEGDQWTMNNCLFLNNSASNPWGTSQTCTATMEGAHSVQWPAPEIDEDPPCGGDTLMADPLVGELSDNGGATLTIPLLEGSPCIDAGDQCQATDQRGEPRHGPCDIGAFERQ
jgi:fibronectin-binding autotransporter adhesin